MERRVNVIILVLLLVATVYVVGQVVRGFDRADLSSVETP
jgi:hypothetical protein